jgi:FkbM family methyltransferase
LARRVPTVDSFEPNPDLVARVGPVLAHNVTLHPVAVGDHSGPTQLWIPPGGMGTEGRATVETDWRTHPAGRLETVEMQRLDDVDLPEIGFIKIDVEGHELAVLRGAAGILRTQRPNLIVEIEEREHSEGHFEAIVAFLADLGYHGSFLSGREWRPIEEFDRATARDLTARVSTHGFATNFVLYARRHIHNFLFRPL